MRGTVRGPPPKQFDYPQFEVGNVVKLNSGSPHMTIVRGTNHSGTVACSWFDMTGGFTADQEFPALAVSRVIPG